MLKKIFGLMFILFMAFQLSAFAAINIGQRTGTLKITMPDSTVLIIAPGDPLPVIPDGATLEVVSGIAEISTTGASTVQVVAGGQTINVTPASTISISFEATGAVIVGVTEGSANIVTASGGTAHIDAGDQVRVGAGVTAGSGFDVIRGQVTVTQPDGTTTTQEPTTVEGYTPPELPNTDDVDTTVQTEETAADISPVVR